MERNYSGARFLAAYGGSLIHFAADFAACGGKVRCKKLLRTAAGGEES